MSGLHHARMLVVTDDDAALHRITSMLRERDYTIVLARSTTHANDVMESAPIDVALAPQRIRPVSGLQFLTAFRGKHPSCAAILLLDEQEASPEMGAWRHGIFVARTSMDQTQFLAIVAEATATVRRRQRWPRKRLTRPLRVFVGGERAALLDVSYGGLKIEMKHPPQVLATAVNVSLPDLPMVIGSGSSRTKRLDLQAELVWSAAASDGVTVVAGMSIEHDRSAATTWRHFVDRIH